MRIVRVLAHRLLAHRADLEGEDRQAVDHHAGRLRGKARRAGHRALQRVDPDLVALLVRIVAALVEAIDGPLVRGDLGVGNLAPPRHVFLAPKPRVGGA